MKTERYRVIDSPIGRLGLRACENELIGIDFHAKGERRDESAVLDLTQCQLAEYFAGRRKVFSVPFSVRGTPFQERVWCALCDIPYGETVSYGEIARRIQSPKAARAVGRANHQNRLPILVPCHRVIGSGGKLTGFGGGLEIKQALLDLEQHWRLTDAEV